MRYNQVGLTADRYCGRIGDHYSCRGSRKVHDGVDSFNSAPGCEWRYHRYESCCLKRFQDFNTDAADPDRSNPTRHRLERPLDTIRAFEAAIDGSHARRAFARSGTEKFLLGTHS